MAKRLISRQVSQGLYSSVANSLAAMLINLPFQFVATIFFGTILYFFASYAQTGDRWAFWIWVLFFHEISMNSLFRLFAFLAPSLPTAMAMAGAGTGLLLMFGGFVITRTNLQDYALGAYYLSPFSWSLRALVINEFGSSNYDTVVRGPNGSQRVGDLYEGAYP